MVAVVVVGTGAAGLAAALAAAISGADVTVLERSRWVGGTTAVSGGVVWAPGNHLAGGDDPADALGYLDALAAGDVDRSLMARFVAAAGPLVRTLEDHTPLRFAPLADWPDYHAELPGGRLGGRSLWPEPLTVAPEVAGMVRPAPDGRDEPPAAGPVTDGAVFRGPVRGRALVAGLLAACLDLGVEVRTGCRVGQLVDGGVVADGDRVEGRVVLACGGFQHAPDLVAAFLPPAGVVPLGPPECDGDGLRLAMGSGAALGNMAEGWWMPALSVPGERADGAAYHRPLHHERAQAGSLMVDGHGRRFVDEAADYGDVGRAMLRFATGTPSWPAAPAHLLFDAAYRATVAVGPLRPGDPDPGWLAVGDTPEAAAAACGLPPATVADEVARFNRHAARGEDPDFGRGGRHYDRWISGGRPLAPLREAPFYAVAVRPGCLGTKGGPRTDAEGRVVGVDGRPRPGLYAAGNAAASCFGTATAAGGSTLGPALVFGWRAGQAAVVD